MRITNRIISTLLTVCLLLGSLSVLFAFSASAEETTASIEELVATISQMCNDIKEVKDETDVLLDSVNVFTISKE